MHRIVGMNRWLVAVFVAMLSALPAWSQQATGPDQVRILAIDVEGVASEFDRAFIVQTSGLQEGQSVTLPGDAAISDAIRNIHDLGLYSDIQVVETRRLEDGIFLSIRVQSQPKLAAYRIDGLRRKHVSDIEERIPLIVRSPIMAGAVERSVQHIANYLSENGFPLATVQVERIPREDDPSSIDLIFNVDRGPRVEVGELAISGNTEFPTWRLKSKMETKEKTWWRFWGRENFDNKLFQEDLDLIRTVYAEEGFYDARIVRDSTYMTYRNGDPVYIVEVDIAEGTRYAIRDINWEGNTIYTDEVLTSSLGLQEGEYFNQTLFEENLYGNKRSNDVASMYMNQGYMRFNVMPSIRVVGDSLDVNLDVFEGDTYRFGDIYIAGNTKTKEHVIRRELITVPGNTFGRDAIQESIRRLMQLSYFAQESLAAGPGIEVNDADKSVDLTYNLEESSSDQLELSGTWGRFGLVLQLRFTFNNFSGQNLFKRDEWRPLPSGDGQKLSVAVQTNGRYYQQYSLSFTEPWYRGRPRQIGGSLSYSSVSQSPFSYYATGELKTASAAVFYEQRLKWPDDLFAASMRLGYQFYDNQGWLSTLPRGISQQVTLRPALSRNSTDHPFFPSSGSKMNLSLELAPPLGDLIQYHKWRFQSTWNMPLAKKLSIGFSTDLGAIGSLTGEEVAFERFVVGGSPFETQGYYNYFGKDIVYMRGYPIASLGPRLDDEPVGGRILTKYATELRWIAIQSEQLQAAPYLFLDAANTWNNHRTYDPLSLYRSAGMGVRMFMPILGLIELAYGYNFDTFVSPTRNHSGGQQWTFQFSLGQGFGQ
jgi:outer membrane protein insertion porin family